MAENINWTSLYIASNERSISELQLLNEKLQVQLKADLNKIYTESLYTDIEIAFDNGSIQTHSSLLKSRTPRFFSELFSKNCPSPSVVILSEVDQLSIESFIREIYTQNRIQDKEIAIVEYLTKLKQLKEEVLTPESDIYLTPKSSPTGIQYNFEHTRCASDTGLSSLLESSDSKYLQTTNTLYYSLVTVDEVYSCESDDVLEKELAEQDQLFKSFKSIISRESKISKCEKQLTLAPPFSKPLFSQNNLNTYLPLKNVKKKSNGLNLNLCLKQNLKNKNVCRQFKSGIKGQISNSEINFTISKQNANSKVHNNLKETNNVCYNSKLEAFPFTTKTSVMNKTKSEIDENMEAESVGPDSCLEAGSSGYLTGSSPKDHTSDTFGGDLTEVATSEDIPHDNDQSARSSSMSSDAGTWDSAFPTGTEAATKEQCPDDNFMKIIENGDHDRNIIGINDEQVNIESFVVCYPISLVQTPQTTSGLKHLQPEYQENYGSLSDNVSKEYQPDKYVSSQGEENLTENRISYANIPTICSYSNSNKELLLDSTENRLFSGKNNFFIDAASLLDENEMSSMPPNSLSYNGSELAENSNLSSWTGSENDNKQSSNTEINENFNEKKFVKGETGFTYKEISPSADQRDFEIRRGSFIRRNTFELELDEDRLAVLRHECQRHKDKVLHQNSVGISHNTNADEICIQGTISTVLNQAEKHIPNSLPIALNSSSFPQKYEDEVHSPDSLNNDGPVENLLETRHKKDNTSHSLPYELNGVVIEPKNNHVLNAGAQNHAPQVNPDSVGTIHLENKSIACDSTVSSGFSSTNNIFKGSNLQSKIESIPIISGVVSLKDSSSPERTFCSPLMNRRKTEFTPIVSGEKVIELEHGEDFKSKLGSSFTASWIVDMSDTSKSPPETKKHMLNDTLSSTSSNDLVKSDDLQRPNKANSSSLGFFIPLDDPYDEKSSVDSGYKSSSLQMNKNIEAGKPTSKLDTFSSGTNLSSCSSSSCGFYVDLKDNQVNTDKLVEKETFVPDKKLFSMFIDIGESGNNNGTKSKTSSPHVLKKRNHTRTYSGVFSSKHEEKNKLNESQISSESSLELTESNGNPQEKKVINKELTPHLPIKQVNSLGDFTMKTGEKSTKQGIYMFIEAEQSPVSHRRTLPSGLQPSSQRHSWNSESHSFNPPKSSGDSVSKRVHRRSHSVSVNKSLEVMFSVDQSENKSSSVSPVVKVSTSNSIGYESGPSSIDDTASRYYNKSMMASWHGSVKPSTELQKVISKSESKDFKENKTHSMNKSPVDSRSEFVGEMCESISKSDELHNSNSKGDLSNASNESSNTGIHNSTFAISDVSNVANATSNELEITTPTCDVVSQLSKDDSDKTETDFDDVCEKKSEDIPRTPDHSISQVEIPEAEHRFSFVKLSDMDNEPRKMPLGGKNYINRMSRSIPEASWIESKMMTRSATSRSLSRLFPHLNTSARNLTPDSADHDTDFSEISSMQSSMDPSALEGSTEETDASSSTSGPVSRLGEDLLRMFLDEISPDVTVEVGGRRIKAHKCILSSRCQYFAAILSGGWVESAGNVISLQGFSYNAVHFALCHIYSGASNIPDSINIVELATLADMLCLEGLKEVIMYTLKVKYCHFFHKPCPMCTVGVLECLPLAAAYGLDEIYRKSLRWITKYFVRVWPTKGFATLPRELLDKCYKQHIVHMTVDNVLETILCCSKLQGLIPNVRWAEPVFTMATKLCDAAVKFIAQHFCDILSSDVFMSLGKEQLWTMSQLEETLLSAAEKLPPDQACKCHSHLYKLTAVIHSACSPFEIKLNDGFVEFLHLLSTTVESCLLKQAARASRTPAWTLMEPQLRHKIQDAACLVIVPGDDRRRARHLLKRGEVANIGKRSADLVPVKPAVTEASVTKKSLHPVRSAAALTKPKPPQVSTKTESTGSRPKTWPYKISEVKSRYLEPKATPKQSPALTTAKQDKTTLTPTARRNVSKSIISSSDSSRTSSPAMRRSLPQRPSRSLPSKDSSSCSKREDSLTMSTDSLADPSASSTKKKPEASFTQGVGRNQPFSRNDFVERNTRSLSVKTSGIKMTSAETVSRVTLDDTKGKSGALSKVEGIKPKYSPIPISKRSSSQNSPCVKDSPVPQVKSTVNSTLSPSIRRNTLSPKEKSQSTVDTKSTLLKRTSTYRVQAKASSPLKVSTIKPKEQVGVSPNTKGNINKNQLKINSSKKSMANNNIVSNKQKTETKPQPMVGSRSGTFLKDEPTVLKKPQVVNVSE